MITVVDYGIGNISAFLNVYARCNIPVKVARNKADLLEAKKIILPGVGHFDHAMQQLNKSGMRDTLDNLVLQQSIPVLGICVGMQMMANSSEEGSEPGLGWFTGTVQQINKNEIPYDTKLPHMGWNTVRVKDQQSVFKNIKQNSEFYFLHSYIFECSKQADVLAETEYGSCFAAAVHHHNKFGIQFHPEKSHLNGEILLTNFAKI